LVSVPFGTIGRGQASSKDNKTLPREAGTPHHTPEGVRSPRLAREGMRKSNAVFGRVAFSINILTEES